MDNNHFKEQVSPAPAIERVRHDTRRRTLSVESVVDITPGMRRISLAGDDLADFTSLAPDDHIKIFIPGADGDEERRDYTPRRYDNAERRLTIDFALHEAGPVTRWAIGARLGDRLDIGGPRGSAVVSPTVKRWLLIGDETALPAIGRRIEESGAGTVITTIAAVAGPQDEQSFDTRAELDVPLGTPTSLAGNRCRSAAEAVEHSRYPAGDLRLGRGGGLSDTRCPRPSA